MELNIRVIIIYCGWMNLIGSIDQNSWWWGWCYRRCWTLGGTHTSLKPLPQTVIINTHARSLGCYNLSSAWIDDNLIGVGQALIKSYQFGSNCIIIWVMQQQKHYYRDFQWSTTWKDETVSLMVGDDVPVTSNNHHHHHHQQQLQQQQLKIDF